MEQTSSQHRYLRQQRFSQIGETGQRRINQAKVLLCGCGALGTMIAERLARAGVGMIRLVDRDWVELSNLQRQTLFTEQHASEVTPKAMAAATELERINSSIEYQPIVDDVTCDNIADLAGGCDLILDGTDNFETRFLINDYCLKHSIPWIHGGCLGASGQILSILPGETACFRCLMPELPPAEALQSCDTAGVLGPTIGIVASWQALEALKVLSGNRDAVCRQLIVLDSWSTDCRLLTLKRVANCRACNQQDWEFLEGRIRSESTVLCGKNAVQVNLPNAQGAFTDLAGLSQTLAPLGKVQINAFFLRLQLDEFRITLFRGGRAVVEGTTQPAQAKSILSRILGG